MSFFLSLIRGVLTTVGIALIAIGLGIVFAKPQTEEAVRRSMEADMTEAFGVPVTIAELRVSLLRRAVRAQGIVVASPSDFREEPALICDEVLVKIEPLTLLTGTPMLHRVEVRGATMNYRYKVGTGTNIGMLTAALEQHQSNTPGDRRYRVALLQCNGAKVIFSTNVVPLANVGMRVVNLRRENLDESDPLSGVQISRVFLLSLLKEAVTLHGIVDPVVEEIVELFH